MLIYSNFLHYKICNNIPLIISGFMRLNEAYKWFEISLQRLKERIDFRCVDVIDYIHYI